MRLPEAHDDTSSGFEPMIPLINVVFLILIFFLIATTLRPFAEAEIDVSRTNEARLDRPVRDGLIIVKSTDVGTRAGLIRIGTAQGDDTGLETVAREGGLLQRDRKLPVILVADGKAESVRLVRIGAALARLGFTDVRLMVQTAGASQN